MATSSALLIAIAAFAVLNYWLLPSVDAAIKHANGTRPLRFGVFAIIQHLRNLSLSAVVAYGLVSFALLFLPDLSPDNMSAAYTRANDLEAIFKRLALIWKSPAFLGTAVLFVAAITYSKNYLRDQFQRAYQAEIERLVTLRDERPSEWAELPETEDMLALSARVRQINQFRDALPGDAPNRHAQVQQLNERAKYFFNQRAFLDIARRVNLEWGAIREKLDDMSGTGKGLSYAAATMFFVGLLSAHSTAAVATVQSRLATIADLAVQSSLDKSEARLAAAESQRSSDQQQANAATIQRVSRLFERAFVKSAAGAVVSERTPDETRRLVRAMVRERTRRPSEVNGILANGHEPPSSTAGSIGTEVERQWLQRKFSQVDGLGEALNRRVSTHFAKYGELADVASVSERLVGDAVAAIIGQPSLPTSDLVTEVAKAMPAATHATIKKMFRTSLNNFMVDLSGGLELEAALTRVVEGPWPAPVASSLLSDFRSTLQSECVAKAAEARLARVTSNREPSVQHKELARDINALHEYFAAEPELRRFLPSFDSDTQLVNLVDTIEAPRDVLLKQWGVQDVNGMAARVERSTALEQLVPYSRVGGILFGRRPTGSTVEDLRGLSWSIEGETASIAVRLPNGQPVAIASTSAAVVRQALGFAADGRPTVVTMLNTAFPGVQQVMLHPTLVDSALGCELIAADQWIFDYLNPAGEPSPLREAMNAADADARLYRSVWARLTTTESSPKVQPSLAFHRIAKSSVLFGVPSAFDQRVVGAIDRCTTSPSDSQIDCVRRETKGGVLTGDAPRTAFVSQIRDAPYSLGGGLSAAFALPSGTAGPLELTVQMSIDDKLTWEPDGIRGQATSRAPAALEMGGRRAALSRIVAFARLQRLFRLAFDGQLGQQFRTDQVWTLFSALPSPTSVTTPKWIERRDERGMIERQFALYVKQISSALPEVATTWPVGQVTSVQKALNECSAAIDASKEPESISDEQWSRQCSMPSALADFKDERFGTVSSVGEAINRARQLRNSLHIMSEAQCR